MRFVPDTIQPNIWPNYAAELYGQIHIRLNTTVDEICSLASILKTIFLQSHEAAERPQNAKKGQPETPGKDIKGSFAEDHRRLPTCWLVIFMQ